jgi:hypothetical protein
LDDDDDDNDGEEGPLEFLPACLPACLACMHLENQAPPGAKKLSCG